MQLNDLKAVAASEIFPFSCVAADPGTRIGAGCAALSPAGSYNSTTVVTALVTNLSAIWGRSAIRGTDRTQALNAIWGTSSIWGAKTAGAGAEAIAINGEQ